MRRRLHPAWFAFGGSLVLFVGLSVALYWETFAEWLRGRPPLSVYCAEALRVPLEAVAKDYEAETGQKVMLHVGPGLEVINRTCQILEPHDHVIAIDGCRIGCVVRDCTPALVGPLIDRDHQRASALHNEPERVVVQVRLEPLVAYGIPTWELDEDLIGW